MTILVTGATGFLGRNVLDQLARDGHRQVHAFARVGRVPAEYEWVRWHTVDVLDGGAVSEVVRAVSPTHLLHLAWIGGEHLHDRYHSSLNSAWAKASRHLFTAFAESGGRRLVNAGSCLEYGGTPSPWDEDAATLPETAYGQGKLESSHAALGQIGVSAAVGRIFFTYGRYEDRRRLVPDVVISLLRGVPVALSAGTQKRDYLHMGDVAQALVDLVDAEHGGIYNIASGRSVTVSSVAEEVACQLGRQDLLRFGVRPTGGDTADELGAVPDKIQADLGWRPQYDLTSGLADVIDWWRHELVREGVL